MIKEGRLAIPVFWCSGRYTGEAEQFPAVTRRLHMVNPSPVSSPSLSPAVIALIVFGAWLPFLLALLLPHQLPAFLMTLTVGLILFVVPGIGWAGFDSDGGFDSFFRIFLTSVGLNLLAWSGVALWPGPTSRVTFLLALATITSIGIWRGARSGRLGSRPVCSPLWLPLLLVATILYGQPNGQPGHQQNGHPAGQ